MLTGLTIFKHSVKQVCDKLTKATFALQQKSSDSRSIRIHAHSIYSDSLAVCTGKSIWVSRIVLCYLRMDVNLTNFIESNPGQPKNPFPYFVLTQPVIKKIVPPLTTSAVIYKNEENFSEVLALGIRAQSEDFLCFISYFSVNGYIEWDEKVSGIPKNPEKFGLV